MCLSVGTESTASDPAKPSLRSPKKISEKDDLSAWDIFDRMFMGSDLMNGGRHVCIVGDGTC